MSYKSEFGADFDLGFDLYNYPYLRDNSWHNNVSPSFYFNVGSQYYVLWVDYADHAQREDTNPRYLIQKAINEGDEKHPEIYASNGDIIFESELIVDLNQFLNSLRDSHDHTN